MCVHGCMHNNVSPLLPQYNVNNEGLDDARSMIGLQIQVQLPLINLEGLDITVVPI